MKGDVGARQTAEAAVPWFDSRIFHNDPDALQDHCVILYKHLLRQPKKLQITFSNPVGTRSYFKVSENLCKLFPLRRKLYMYIQIEKLHYFDFLTNYCSCDLPKYVTVCKANFYFKDIK